MVLENRNKQTEEGVYIPPLLRQISARPLHDLYSPYFLEPADGGDIRTSSPGDDRILVVKDYKRSQRT
jgi:hypothetical protein